MKGRPLLTVILVIPIMTAVPALSFGFFLMEESWLNVLKIWSVVTITLNTLVGLLALVLRGTLDRDI